MDTNPSQRSPALARKRPPFHRLVRPAAALLVALAACTAPPPPEQEPIASDREPSAPDTLRYEMASLVLEGDEAGSDGTAGAHVAFAYPEIPPQDAPAADVAAAWVHARLVESWDPDRAPDASPQAWAEGFLDQFAAFAAEMPDAPGGWFVDRTIRVVRNDPRVVALELEEAWYMGGAHPNGVTVHLNLDAGSGAAVESLAELLVPDGAAKLLARGRGRLREDRGIPEGETLTDFGFWEDELPLPASFLLGRDGLVLVYQAYDIAPYAMGPSAIVLSWEAVADLFIEPTRWRP